VLLADDNAGMRTAIRRLLSLACDVVSCVGDTASLFDAVAELRPDVVLLDLSLAGDLPGFEVCRQITSGTPDVKVVILSAHDGPSFRDHARECGASGYVSKLQASDDLLPAIHAVVERAPLGDEGTR
jgi:two-component system uhpT operon response regulator UhpA